jgi:hypothetical protein
VESDIREFEKGQDPDFWLSELIGTSAPEQRAFEIIGAAHHACVSFPPVGRKVGLSAGSAAMHGSGRRSPKIRLAGTKLPGVVADNRTPGPVRQQFRAQFRPRTVCLRVESQLADSVTIAPRERQQPVLPTD